MSREVIVKKRDDLDPSVEADETIEFRFEGWEYTTDLCAENAAVLREFMAQFTDAAFEKKRVQVVASTGRESLALPDDLRDKVRRWGRKNGMAEQASHKQISFELRSAYYDATADDRILSPNLIVYRQKREREQIRQWANENGRPLSPTGIIPAEVVEAFKSGVPIRKVPRGAEAAAMRQWARDNGYVVSDRGIVPQVIQDAYNQQMGA